MYDRFNQTFLVILFDFLWHAWFAFQYFKYRLHCFGCHPFSISVWGWVTLWAFSHLVEQGLQLVGHLLSLGKKFPYVWMFTTVILSFPLVAASTDAPILFNTSCLNSYSSFKLLLSRYQKTKPLLIRHSSKRSLLHLHIVSCLGGTANPCCDLPLQQGFEALAVEANHFDRCPRPGPFCQDRQSRNMHWPVEQEICLSTQKYFITLAYHPDEASVLGVYK